MTCVRSPADLTVRTTSSAHQNGHRFRASIHIPGNVRARPSESGSPRKEVAMFWHTILSLLVVAGIVVVVLGLMRAAGALK
jgi:hypothetical protein